MAKQSILSQRHRLSSNNYFLRDAGVLTVADQNIRRGGSQFMLMKVLGHTSLEMTMKYVQMQTDDLSAIHNRLSLLAR